MLKHQSQSHMNRPSRICASAWIPLLHFIPPAPWSTASPQPLALCPACRAPPTRSPTEQGHKRLLQEPAYSLITTRRTAAEHPNPGRNSAASPPPFMHARQKRLFASLCRSRRPRSSPGSRSSGALRPASRGQGYARPRSAREQRGPARLSIHPDRGSRPHHRRIAPQIRTGILFLAAPMHPRPSAKRPRPHDWRAVWNTASET